MAKPNFYYDGCLIYFLVMLIAQAQFGAGDDAVLLGGKKLIVGVPKKDGFTQFVDAQLSPINKTQLVKVTGYSIEVFNATVDYLRNLGYVVSFEFQAFVDEATNSAGSYDMLLYEMYRHKYDAVVGDVTIGANRSNYVDFTLPYVESDVMMLVKVQKDRHLDMWIFLKPFRWDLWLSIVAFSTFVGGTILFMERNVSRDGKSNNSPTGEQVTWVSSLFVTLAHLDRESVVKNCSRFVLVLWFILGCILMQSYTANLSSILTLDQLKLSHPNVGYQCGSYVKDLLKDRLKYDESRLKSLCTIEEYKAALDKGSHNDGVDAIFDEVPYIKVFLKEYGSNYAMVGPRYRTDGFGFAFPKDSNLTSYFSRAILYVTKCEVMDQIEFKYFGSNDEDKLQDQSNLSSDCNTATPSLTPYSFAGLFMVIGILILLALLLSETSHFWKKPVTLAKNVSTSVFTRRSATNGLIREGSTVRGNVDEGSTRSGNVGSPGEANNHREEMIPSISPSNLAI